jgi:sulfur carrier protein
MDSIDIAETIKIVVNGAPHQVPPAHTLLDLVTALALPDQALALAVNRNVVRRQDWAQQVLASGDQVDIVRAIGGG